jgi:hypothetical protein
MKLESQEGLEKHLTGKQYLEVLMPQAYSASRNLKTVTQTGNPSRFSQDPQMFKLSTFSYNSASQPFALNVRVWSSRVRIPALKSAIVTVVVYDFPQSFLQISAVTGPQNYLLLHLSYSTFVISYHFIL